MTNDSKTRCKIRFGKSKVIIVTVNCNDNDTNTKCHYSLKINVLSETVNSLIIACAHTTVFVLILHRLGSKSTNNLTNRFTSSSGMSKDGIKYQLRSRFNARLVFMFTVYLVLLFCLNWGCDIIFTSPSNLSYCNVIVFVHIQTIGNIL